MVLRVTNVCNNDDNDVEGENDENGDKVEYNTELLDTDYEKEKIMTLKMWMKLLIMLMAI